MPRAKDRLFTQGKKKKRKKIIIKNQIPGRFGTWGCRWKSQWQQQLCFAEIPSPSLAQDHLQPFGKIREIWVCSQTCGRLFGPSLPIHARISCTETQITFSKTSCSKTLQQNPQINEVWRAKLTLSVRAAPLAGLTTCYKLLAKKEQKGSLKPALSTLLYADIFCLRALFLNGLI